MMNPYAQRIEELRTAAQVRGIDLTEIHVHEPLEWIKSAASILGYDPALAMAAEFVPFEMVLESQA